MPKDDARLTNPLVMAIAGLRLLHRQDHPPLPDWEKAEGLAALLGYAQQCGVRDLSAVDDDDLPTTGMGQLLREARQWHREHGHGA